MKFKYYKELLKEKFQRNNIKSFFKRQGFYVILFLCVAAVGITALIVAGNQTKEELAVEPADNESIAVENTEDETLNEAIMNMMAYPPLKPKESTEEVTVPEISVVKKSGAKLSLARPMEGVILNEFSGEIVVFNQSLNQWASHNAIDIEAKEGDSVLAAKAGEVIDVYEDALCGGVVVIAHGKDMKSVYKNIIPDPDLSPEDKVDEGSVIGTIGKPGLKEDYLGPHLHFEFYINNLAVDPQKYFK